MKFKGLSSWLPMSYATCRGRRLVWAPGPSPLKWRSSDWQRRCPRAARATASRRACRVAGSAGRHALGPRFSRCGAGLARLRAPAGGLGRRRAEAAEDPVGAGGTRGKAAQTSTCVCPLAQDGVKRGRRGLGPSCSVLLGTENHSKAAVSSQPVVFVGGIGSPFSGFAEFGFVWYRGPV